MADRGHPGDRTRRGPGSSRGRPPFGPKRHAGPGGPSSHRPGGAAGTPWRQDRGGTGGYGGRPGGGPERGGSGFGRSFERGQDPAGAPKHPRDRAGPPGTRRDGGGRPAPDRPRRDDQRWLVRPARDGPDRPRDRHPDRDIAAPADRSRQHRAGPPRPAGHGPPGRSGQGSATNDRPRPAVRKRPSPAADGQATEELVERDAELIAGRHPVEEAFKARRAARRLLVTPARRAALEGLVLHATTLRIPVVEVEGGTLTSVAGFDGHQGVALVVEPRHWATPAAIVARAAERGERPFLLVLDALEDPQNVGTLLRSAEAAGVHGVIFPTRRQAPLTPAAVKSSAGAVEHLLLAPVDDLPGALVDLHTRGVRLVGADEDAPLSYREADLRGPLALVVGSEGQGLSSTTRRRLDLSVRIPMRGRVASLNAAVAGTVLLFEAAGQRDAAAGAESGVAPAGRIPALEETAAPAPRGPDPADALEPPHHDAGAPAADADLLPGEARRE